MLTDCREWTDGADAEMQLVTLGMKGEEGGAGGRDSRTGRRSPSVCVHIDV